MGSNESVSIKVILGYVTSLRPISDSRRDLISHYLLNNLVCLKNYCKADMEYMSNQRYIKDYFESLHLHNLVNQTKHSRYFIDLFVITEFVKRLFKAGFSNSFELIKRITDILKIIPTHAKLSNLLIISPTYVMMHVFRKKEFLR